MVTGLKPLTRRVLVAITATFVAGMSAAPAAAADVDIRIVGGTGSAAIACGNVAAAQELARKKGIVLQKSNCTATGTGGDVTLENVDIYVSAAALALNRDNPVLAAVAGAPPGVATDKCDNHRPKPPGPGRQLNKCTAIARGGSVKLHNVKLVDRQVDGRVTTRTVAQAIAPPGNGGTAAARCTAVVDEPLDQQDDCVGTAIGGAWSMRGVDAVVHNPDGSSYTRRGITIEVRGGTGEATLHCFNVVDGAGKVVQINVCTADARGGDATLRNVTIHTSSR